MKLYKSILQIVLSWLWKRRIVYASLVDETVLFVLLLIFPHHQRIAFMFYLRSLFMYKDKKTLIIKRNPPLIFLPEIPAKLQNLSKTVYDWVLCIFLLFVHWSPYPTWGDKLTATRAVLECIFYDCNMQILIKTTRILTESLININVMNFTFSGRRALRIFMRAI